MLAEEPGIKSADKQKIKGYILRWRDSKMLLGSAFFHDLLKPAAILRKALKEDEVVRAAEALIKALKMINTLKTTV
jgi:phage head maturation protease